MAFEPIAYELDHAAIAAGAGGSFSLALRTGRLVATVVSRKTGKHITIQLRAKRREGKRFRACELDVAQRIYVDVPSSDASGGAEVGILHMSGKWDGKLLPPWGTDFDQARVWAARRVLDIATGRAATADEQAEILEGKICLLCGRDLTDPESIARNIGPECWRKATSSEPGSGQHQAPGTEQETFAIPSEAEVIARDARNAEEEHAEAHMGRYPGDPDFDQVGREEEGNAEDGAMGYPARDVEAEVDELAGKVSDENGRELSESELRAEIEAELQQTVKPPASESVESLTEDLGGPTVDGDLVLLRAGEDPREVLDRWQMR
jgi:hypothetical protein